MHAFARLYDEIDATTGTLAKVDAMARYFASATPEDAAWALFFLKGQRFKRVMPVRALARWAMEIARIPDWLFDLVLVAHFGMSSAGIGTLTFPQVPSCKSSSKC